jgi:NAD(P)-dependent dehydrogenase (short-subunit alcohol dehydrogenase family)
MFKLPACKVGAVTGAGGAIGRATALAFAAESASATVSDINADAGYESLDAICSAGGQALAVVGDISMADFSQSLVARTVAHFAGPDSAFNNAGIVDEGGYLWSEDAFLDTLNVDLLGIMLGIKYQVPEMRKRGGGTIVNCSSVTGLVSQSGPPYQPTRAASIQLSVSPRRPRFDMRGKASASIEYVPV